MRILRESKGLTQAVLAQRAGVPQSVISDIESGKTKAPRIDTIKAIAAVLGVTMDEIVEAINATVSNDNRSRTAPECTPEYNP